MILPIDIINRLTNILIDSSAIKVAIRSAVAISINRTDKLARHLFRIKTSHIFNFRIFGVVSSFTLFLLVCRCLFFFYSYNWTKKSFRATISHSIWIYYSNRKCFVLSMTCWGGFWNSDCYCVCSLFSFILSSFGRSIFYFIYIYAYISQIKWNQMNEIRQAK